jgi:hypothetical protein
MGDDATEDGPLVTSLVLTLGPNDRAFFCRCGRATGQVDLVA